MELLFANFKESNMNRLHTGGNIIKPDFHSKPTIISTISMGFQYNSSNIRRKDSWLEVQGFFGIPTDGVCVIHLLHTTCHHAPPIKNRHKTIQSNFTNNYLSRCTIAGSSAPQCCRRWYPKMTIRRSIGWCEILHVLRRTHVLGHKGYKW